MSTPNPTSGWLSPVISGLSGYFGSSGAANAQVAGETNAIGTEQNLGQTVQGIYGQQTTTGNQAFTSLGQQLGLNGQPADYSAFNNSPGYQFSVQQGTQAINREAAAAGNLYTPNTLTNVGSYVTGTAAQNYNQYMNQLLQTAGYGASGNANEAQNLTSIGDNIAQLQVGVGNANASAATGEANALGSAAGQLANNLLGSGSSGAAAAGTGANASGVNPSSTGSAAGTGSIPASQSSVLGSLNGANPFAAPGGGAPAAGDLSSLANTPAGTLPAGVTPAVGAAPTAAELGSTSSALSPLVSGGAPATTAAVSASQSPVLSSLGGANPFAATTGGAPMASDLSSLANTPAGTLPAGMAPAVGSEPTAAELGAGSDAVPTSPTFGAGQALGAAGAAYSLYNFGKNWQSGATGSDALSGAGAGAATGAEIGSIVPGIGTLVGGVAGAVIGGAVGAISSAFGGGKTDPETLSWNNLAPTLSKDPAAANSLTPSQAFQSLAGVMDAKNNSPGHSTNLELQFGRMGENQVVTNMSSWINSAIAQNPSLKSATPAQLYSQVVEPQLKSKGAYVNSTDIVSSNGTKAGGSVDALLTRIIGLWQSGNLTSQTSVGINGQTISGLPAYGGSGGSSSTPTAAPRATTQPVAATRMSALGYKYLR